MAKPEKETGFLIVYCILIKREHTRPTTTYSNMLNMWGITFRKVLRLKFVCTRSNSNRLAEKILYILAIFVWIKYTVTSEILLKELQVHNKIKIHVSFVNIVSGKLFFEKIKTLKNPSQMIQILSKRFYRIYPVPNWGAFTQILAFLTNMFFEKTISKYLNILM